MILSEDREPWDSIVGIDPGGMTGFFALRLGAGRRLADRIRSGEHFIGQIPSGGMHPSIPRDGRGRPRVGVPLHLAEARSVRSMAGRIESVFERWCSGPEDGGVLHLAVEDFVLREHTADRSLLAPVRITSGLLALLEESSEGNYVVHVNSAADAKSTISDDVLRRYGLYAPGMAHAMDAARQALLVLRKGMSSVRG